MKVYELKASDRANESLKKGQAGQEDKRADPSSRKEEPNEDLQSRAAPDKVEQPYRSEKGIEISPNSRENRTRRENNRAKVWS
ncbi:hypothetical protein CASFOL_017980 [Castilleja foliolosa]|uniref:Uncharacterized protein n=1 Tax=Castilleja foliolosa TaxID=1961234 RepID=A0ABD3DB33_9LAMI